MTLILQVFYTLFSSLLLALAIPNELISYGSPYIAFAALIPYYLAVKHSKNFKTAFLLGFIHSCVTHLISSYWLAFFKDFAAITLGASALGTGLFGSLFGALLYLPYYTEKRRNVLYLASASYTFVIPFRIFWFAAVYTSYEWFKSTGFLGYPWGTLSSCMFGARIFMQLSAITGTYGISFLTAYFSAIIGEGVFLLFKLPNLPSKKRIFNAYRTCVSFWTVLFGLSLIYGAFSYSKKRTPIKTLTSILVQQNEDPWKSGSDRDTIIRSQELTLNEIQKLNEEGRKADLIVWSEGALKTPFPDGKSHYQNFPYDKSLSDFIQEVNTPLLTGGSYVQRYNDGNLDFFNAALVFDKNANFRGWYGKNHLVPFAEAIPFMEIPAIRNFMESVIRISAGWTPGRQYTYFDIPCKWADRPVIPAVKNISLLQDYSEQMIDENQPPVTRISTPICFDDAFKDVCNPLWKNGSEVFMNMSDDSWSLKKSSEIQHFVIASYRAIEYRTTLVRSTNAGYTTVVDPAGKILTKLPLFESCAASFDVPVYKRQYTTYAKFGNWLPFVLITFILFIFVYEIFAFESYENPFSERKIKKHHKKHAKKEKKSEKKAEKKKSSKKTKKSKK